MVASGVNDDSNGAARPKNMSIDVLQMCGLSLDSSSCEEALSPIRLANRSENRSAKRSASRAAHCSQHRSAPRSAPRSSHCSWGGSRAAVSLVVLLGIVLGIGCSNRSAPAVPEGQEINPELISMLGMVAKAQSEGEYPLAAFLLDSISVRYPDHSRVEFFRGVQFDGTGFEADAKSAYERSRELDPSFPGAWHNLGTIYAREHSYRQALNAYQEAVRLEPTAAAWQGVGNAYFELGRVDSAEVALRNALKIDGAIPAIRLALASVLDKQGRTDAALEALAPCASTTIDSACAKEYAVQLMKKGQMTAALDSLRLVQEIRPWDKEVYFSLGQALAANGLDSEAEESRIAFAEIDSLDRQIFRLNERIALNPGSLRDRLELADNYRIAGRPMDAARTLNSALVLAPNNLHIRNNIGVLLLESEQYEDARRQFEFILAADSTFTSAQRNLQRIDSMGIPR